MLTRFHQIALLDEATGQVLVVPGEDGLRLPTHPQRWPDLRDLAAAVGAPGAQLAGPPFREDDGTVTNVLVGDRTTRLEGEWRDLHDLGDVEVSSAAAAGIARGWDEYRSGAAPDGRAAWFLRGWRDEVVGWVDEVGRELGFERLGLPETVKIWSLSAVLRFRVRRGDDERELWFKATCDGFRAEPVLTRAVRAVAPDITPSVLAVDEDRAWMLMKPLAGAAEGAPVERAPEIARRLARFQLETLAQRSALARAGVPRRGLAATLQMVPVVARESVDLMSAEQRAMARDLEPWIAEQVRRAWAHPLPDVLAHGDLHLGNVAWVGAERGGRPVLFDWTDACLTHPLFDAWHLADSAADEAGAERAQEARAQVRDAFLEVWSEARPDVDLRAAWEDARLAEAIFQAITYEQIYRAQPETSRWELATVVAGILDKLAEVRAASLTRT